MTNGSDHLPLPSKFWRNVDKNGPAPEHRPELGPCWLWTKSLNHHGYGRVGTMRNGVNRTFKAHRVSYELVVGPIPDGMQLDHLCRVYAASYP